MDVTVFYHPVDTVRHPAVPSGWRWAVVVNGGDPGDMSRCANAGWAPGAAEALASGDACGATAARCLQMAGLLVRYRDPVRLDHDPTPPDGSIHVI